MSTDIKIVIEDNWIHPTTLIYEHKHGPDSEPYIVFRKDRSSINQHEDVISACDELEDHLCRIVNRIREHSDYIAPSRAREVVNG